MAWFVSVRLSEALGVAWLGLRGMVEQTGSDTIAQPTDRPTNHPTVNCQPQRTDAKLAKTAGLDLSFLTTYAGPSGRSSERIASAVKSNGPVIDDRILADAEVMDAIKNEKVRLFIVNYNSMRGLAWEGVRSLTPSRTRRWETVLVLLLLCFWHGELCMPEGWARDVHMWTEEWWAQN